MGRRPYPVTCIPSGYKVLATPRAASVCVRNRISTVPDTIVCFLRKALLCDLCVSSPACSGTGGRILTSFSMKLFDITDISVLLSGSVARKFYQQRESLSQ